MKEACNLLFRYLAILCVGLGSLFLFYKLLFPPTFYLTTWILNLFGSVKAFPSLGFFIYNSSAVYLIGACIAGSAYYLLFILLFSTPNIPPFRRVKVLLFTFASLLVLNILRIVLMTLIAGTIYFDSVHLLFWYFISIVFVIAIWFLAVRIFNIKKIPVYSDIKFLINQLKSSKRDS